MKNKICILGCSILILGVFTGCARDYSVLKPNHIGLRSGIDLEIQEGCKTKTKPGCHACVDWNL